MADDSAVVYAVVVEGLDLRTKSLADIDPAIAKAASLAINDTARRGRTAAADEIGRQINFPSGYLNPATGRLVIDQLSTPTTLRANIAARTRPTSLARFVQGSPSFGRQQGVTVALKPGLARFMPKAFLLKLRTGNLDAGDSSSGNIGLAIRTNGQQPDRAYKPKQIGDNLFLLYGPSVDQVFRGAGDGGRGVRDTIAPALNTYLQAEFQRQLDRLV